MKKIFIFWIVFLIVLAVGVVLAISSKAVLRKEKKRAEELRKTIISRPLRLPKAPAAEVKTGQPKVKVEEPPKPAEEASKAVPETAPQPVSGELPPMQNDMPVQINTNSLEISIPSAQTPNPAPLEESQPNPAAPATGQ